MTSARLLAALIALAACTSSRERERADFERMRIQQRYDLYGGQRAFGPPAGTVTRESALPIDSTHSSMRRGAERFAIYCAVCHGPGGFGGSLVASNMGVPRPPSLRGDSLRARPPQYIFDVATHGKGRMPAYAPQLTADDRWAIVAYVRQLQAGGPLTPEQRADSLLAAQIHALDSIAAAQRK